MHLGSNQMFALYFFFRERELYLEIFDIQVVEIILTVPNIRLDSYVVNILP